MPAVNTFRIEAREPNTRFTLLPHWVGDEPEELMLDQIGESYARYRLHAPEAERVMMRSLENYGQISPVVVCVQEGRTELFDGFKRL